MTTIIILTGAGISRESGLATFRDSDGLWAGYAIEDVCTPEALRRNPKAVLDFYNMRRHEVRKASPNAAHYALADLERVHDTTIITQNVDDLHTRAGSQNVLHLHGEVLKARSTDDFDLVLPWLEDIALGDLAPDGAQLRPHICFFGETPYQWEKAAELAESAWIFCVIGTSLNVYPAAHLLELTRAQHVFLIDPNPPPVPGRVQVWPQPATSGVPEWVAHVKNALL